MTTTLQSGRTTDVQPCMLKLPDGTMLILDGKNSMKRWDGVASSVETAGIAAPTVAPSVTTPTSGGASAGDYTCYYRYKDADGYVSSLSPAATVTAAASDKFSWTITSASDDRVTHVELWRSAVGVPNLIYLITTLNDGTTTYSDDTEADTDLLAKDLDEIQQVVGNDGSPVANRHTPPPSYTRSAVIHQTRAYYGGLLNYREGHAEVTNGSATVTIIGGTVTDVMDGWVFYAKGYTTEYVIDSVNTSANTLTLASNYGGTTSKFLQYGVRPPSNRRNLVHYSAPGEPESVFYDETDSTTQFAFAVRMQEDEDEIVHVGPSMHGYLYVAKRHHLYRINCSNCNPRVSANFQLVVRRGSVGVNCVAVAQDECYFLDTEGVYRVGTGGWEDISEPIRDVFRDAIHWERSPWFFAEVDKRRTVVKFFVCYGGERWPRHALVWNYVRSAWCPIETHWSLGGATLARLSGREVLLVGGEHESVWEMGGSQICDAKDDEALSGTITGATLLTLTDSSAAFTSSMVDLPICITGGTGKRQVRRITERISATKVRVDKPWIVTPDTTSTYLVGGIPWAWRGGIHELVETTERNRREYRLAFEPTENAASFDVRSYLNHSKTPVEGKQLSTQSNIVSFTPGSPDAVVNITRDLTHGESPGAVDFQYGGTSTSKGALSDRYSSIELRGFQGKDEVKIYDVKERGVGR